MRIGSLTSLAFQKYDKTEQRDTVTKHIPGYIQTFNYDLVSTNPTIQIEGTLVGTSASNLASQMETLKAMHRNKKVVWIDASDQYQGLIDFCRITKLQGPTVDSKTGPLIATFSLEAISLLPWGTTQFNPYSATGLVLRDLSGVGHETVLNPLSMSCNFTMSSSLQTDQGGNSSDWFSWEFIVDNQNPFSNARSVQESNCDSTTGFVNGSLAAHTLPAFDSLAVDTSNFKEGIGSIKATKASPSNASTYGFGFDFGSSGVNLSGYDRLRLWAECDEANPTRLIIGIQDTSGNYGEWYPTNPTASVWQNFEVFLKSPDSTSGTVSYSSIRYIYLAIQPSGTPASINLWVDDIRVEVGYLNHCEDTNGWSGTFGSVTSITNDTVVFKASTQPGTPETSQLAALKVVGTTDGGGSLAPQYLQPGGEDFNFSNYDFLVAWLRSDFGGNATGQLELWMGDTLHTNTWDWAYPNCKANQWYRLVVPLRAPSGTAGTPSLSSIPAIWFNARTGTSLTETLWIDEIAVDVGLWTNLEFQIPDNIAMNLTGPVQASTWTGSSYSLCLAWAEPPYSGWYGGSVYFLDGSQAYNDYGPSDGYGRAIYPIAPIGSSVSSVFSNAQNNNTPDVTPITYTTTYGTNNRIVFGMYMPPATSDSQSGNYPSNDLSGPQALNKVRLKILVYYGSEDTTYSGF